MARIRVIYENLYVYIKEVGGITLKDSCIYADGRNWKYATEAEAQREFQLAFETGMLDLRGRKEA